MNPLINMIMSMLKDDHGISEETYNNLYKIKESLNIHSPMRMDLDAIMRQVDATDGRFYIQK